MSKTIIQTPHAPAAIGPYSQSVKVGSMLYTSGQIPLKPDTMALVEGDISTQTHQVFKNLSAIADAYDVTLDDCVKLTIFMTNLENFAAVNEVMQQYFKQPYPARSTIQVSALPKNADIEIEAILSVWRAI